jgi:hypothetical protein
MKNQLLATICLSVCFFTANSQVTDPFEIILPATFYTEDVPESIKGFNQTENTVWSMLNNEFFMEEFPKLGLGSHRFPNGTPANNYDWKEALTSDETLNNLTLKRAIQWKNLSGHEMNYMINFGNSTPEEAAELVRIMNDPSPLYEEKRMHYFDVSEPVGIKIWEIGTELAAKWEWHVSWVAGGARTSIYGTGTDSIHMPRQVTDRLHYFGGEIFRKGWVRRAGSSMNLFNSNLGTMKRITVEDSAASAAGEPFLIEVAFPPIIDPSSMLVYYTQEAINIDQFTNGGDILSVDSTQQSNFYTEITTPQYLLDTSLYQLSGDTAILIDPSVSLITNHGVLIEYKTEHSGAFDFRDAMIEADPTIEIGFCVDFRKHLLDTDSFNERLIQSPPRFIVEHPYNASSSQAVANQLWSETVHMAEHKAIHTYPAAQAELDSIVADLGIATPIGFGLTEWNVTLCGSGGCNLAYNGILGGLYTANFFSQFYEANRNGSVDLRVSNHFAGISPGSNLIHFFHWDGNSPSDPLEITPQSEAMRIMNSTIGDNLVPIDSALISGVPEIEIIAYGDSIDDAGFNIGTVNYDIIIDPAIKIFEGFDNDSSTFNIMLLNQDDALGYDVEIIIPQAWMADLITVENLYSNDISTDTFQVDLIEENILGMTSYTVSLEIFSLTSVKVHYTCDYQSCFCKADFNGDGIVGVLDLLEMLSEFGCTLNCATDLDDDGSVGTSDVLLFLSDVGLICP